MKKLLLSVSLIAASGSYAAVQNHLLDQVFPGLSSSTVDTAELTPATPAAPRIEVVEAVPAPTPVPAKARSPSFSIAAVSRATLATGGQVGGAEALPFQMPGVVEVQTAAIADAVPVLPRRRPDTAPQATLDVAQSNAAALPALGPYRDGTYRGSSENAYYGRVQVQVTVTQGQVASIDVIDFPQDRRTSRYINSQALPLLEREVMQAQDANINMISGATLTSKAYIHSLGKALAKARGGNA